jgi:DNA-binding CsgD family transcriptional regulator
MDIQFNPKRDTKPCKQVKKSHCLDRSKCVLGYVSRAINTCLYLVDFREQRIILGNLSGHTIAGFPTEMIRKEGLGIYHKILLDSEKDWWREMTVQAYKIFDSYEDCEVRMELVLSCDLTAKTPSGREVNLHHRIVPYQLDNDGNLWMVICAISPTQLTHKTTKACIDCMKTGERYDYIDGKFILSEHCHLTEEEVVILGHLADGLPIKAISDKIGLSLRVTERKKKSALDKLGAATQAATVYRATNMGLI